MHLAIASMLNVISLEWTGVVSSAKFVGLAAPVPRRKEGEKPFWEKLTICPKLL